MATVYLARDLKHDRQVALKVLNPELGAVLGADRFLAEIKVTANLQHPNLLPLFDSGDAHGLLFYVMPYVQGESLRARLEREQQLPVDEAVRMSVAIASALDYAHRHGVIHRDLKPENILLHEGQPLVADFGIALAVSAAGGARVTQSGLSLGTPQYMAPEQAMGERMIDARADIYALGAVLYEMLAGEPPFTGPNAQAIVAKVITERAPPVTRYRVSVPAHVAAAIGTALEKVPADRFQSAADFAKALTDSSGMHARLTGSREMRQSRPWIRDRRSWAALGVAGAMLLAVPLLWQRAGSATQMPTISSSLVFAPGEAPSVTRGYAVSPDGARLVYATPAAIDGGRLWIRSLADGHAHALPGTEGARYPFWSFDGTAVGFFANGHLLTVPAAGGIATVLAPAESEFGGAWNREGVVLFGLAGRLRRIAATGGKSSLALPRVLPNQGARHPSFLPDQRHFSYWAYKNGHGAGWIGDLETGTAEPLRDDVNEPVYAEPGMLMFSHGGGPGGSQPLFIQPFDLRRRQLTGKPVVISYLYDRDDNQGNASLSNDILVYADYDTTALHFQTWASWSRADKRLTPFSGPPDNVWLARISHDGRRIAFGGFGLWVREVARDVSVRKRAKLGVALNPLWSPGDSVLAYNGGEGHDRSFQMLPLNGTAEERTIPVPSATGQMLLADWSPDGRTILFLQSATDGIVASELWGYSTADQDAHRVLKNTRSVFDARFSPDGRWIAYESDESGSHEIYLTHYPESGSAIRVSPAGGGSPRWRGDGREIYFIASDGRIMGAAILLASVPSISAPQVMLSEPVTPEPFLGENTLFDVMPAGDRFIVQPSSLTPAVLQIVTGWRGLVKSDSAHR